VILLANAGTISLSGTTSGIVLLVAVTVVMSGFVGLMLSGSITRPLRQSAQAAQRISNGDLTARVAVNNRDELGTLASGLSSMASGLTGLIKETGSDRPPLRISRS